MNITDIVRASERIYAASPVSPDKLSEETGLDKKYILQLKNALDLYIETDASPDQIAKSTALDHPVVVSVLKQFRERCVQAYARYIQQNNASIAWAAEQEGIGRFYFEDFFWRKEHLTDDTEKGQTLLAELRSQKQENY